MAAWAACLIERPTEQCLCTALQFTSSRKRFLLLLYDDGLTDEVSLRFDKYDSKFCKQVQKNGKRRLILDIQQSTM
jgi:hypothetical protein